tara:strand:- start:337 stop:1434 length:1098 start_codon:yes stop_codon:yes gene_type:complete
MSIELSDEQKAAVLGEWESNPNSPPAIKKLTQIAFPNVSEELQDGRSKYGRAVKAYLSSQDLRARGSHEYKPKESIELTDEQKEFVKNNASMMTSVEIARTVFNDSSISNLHPQTRAVNEYIKELGDEVVSFEDVGEVPQEDYKSIKTFNSCLSKVLRFVPNGIDKNKITSLERSNVTKLMGYLSTFRFIHQINCYSNQSDRDLFESSFVRYSYDKPDLTQEEIDQYIVLSSEVIIAASIQRRSERLQELLDTTANDTEGRRINMGLVTAIGTAQTEYNQCITRQTKLLSDLKEKRSTRLSKEIKESASVLNLVELWKEEESRAKLLKMAEVRRSILKEEVERLSTMDEVKARIMGLDEDEVLNG